MTSLPSGNARARADSWPRVVTFLYDALTPANQNQVPPNVPTPGVEPTDWRVLGFGRDPEVSAAIQEGLRARGIRARAFALADDPEGDARLERELSDASWDGVAIGGFINGQNPDVRPDLQTTVWFNRVLNIIHRHVPDAKIILVREPADALPAIERVLGPASRDAYAADERS